MQLQETGFLHLGLLMCIREPKTLRKDSIVLPLGASSLGEDFQGGNKLCIALQAAAAYW